MPRYQSRPHAHTYSDILQLSLQQVRLVIWGETLGLASQRGKGPNYNSALERPDIRPAIEANLCHLRNLLSKADVRAGRYETKDGHLPVDASGNTSTGMVIFRSRFEKFKARLRHNQKQASAWTVTQWSVHDYARFRELVANIT